MRPAGAAPPPRGRGPGDAATPGRQPARPRGWRPGQPDICENFSPPRPPRATACEPRLCETTSFASPNGPHCSSAGALWRYSPARPALRSGMCKDCLRPRRHCRRHRDRAPTGLTRPPFAAPAPRPWPASGAKKRGPVALFPPGQSFSSINSVYLQRKKHKARV